jgi:hypothetical protein
MGKKNKYINDIEVKGANTGTFNSLFASDPYALKNKSVSASGGFKMGASTGASNPFAALLQKVSVNLANSVTTKLEEQEPEPEPEEEPDEEQADEENENYEDELDSPIERRNGNLMFNSASSLQSAPKNDDSTDSFVQFAETQKSVSEPLSRYQSLMKSKPIRTTYDDINTLDDLSSDDDEVQEPSAATEEYSDHDSDDGVQHNLMFSLDDMDIPKSPEVEAHEEQIETEDDLEEKKFNNLESLSIADDFIEDQTLKEEFVGEDSIQDDFAHDYSIDDTEAKTVLTSTESIPHVTDSQVLAFRTPREMIKSHSSVVFEDLRLPVENQEQDFDDMDDFEEYYENEDDVHNIGDLDELEMKEEPTVVPAIVPPLLIPKKIEEPIIVPKRTPRAPSSIVTERQATRVQEVTTEKVDIVEKKATEPAPVVGEVATVQAPPKPKEPVEDKPAPVPKLHQAEQISHPVKAPPQVIYQQVPVYPPTQQIVFEQPLYPYPTVPLFLPQHATLSERVNDELFKMHLHSIQTRIQLNKQKLLELQTNQLERKKIYTTLEKTKEFIARNKRKPITLEEAEKIVDLRDRYRVI